jgi:nucleoside-diphosphate-sugar epimerase
MLTELQPLMATTETAPQTKTTRTCAITGANGYVGSCLRDYFVNDGWRVRELSRTPSPCSPAWWRQFSLESGVAAGALEGTDVLVHCAYDFRPVRRRDIEAVNVGGTARLLQSAQQAGVRRIILISTISAFEGCRSKYGHAKLKMERLALDAGGVVVRPGLVYGPRPGGMFGKLAGVVKKARVIPLVGLGNQPQYLVHQDDLCKLLIDLANTDVRPDRPIIAAHEQQWTFKQILRSLAGARGKRVLLVPFPWRVMWAGLKAAEWMHVPIKFRSDSLVSLVNQDPRPNFSGTRAFGTTFREFEAL